MALDVLNLSIDLFTLLIFYFAIINADSQWRNYHWTKVNKVQGAPEWKGPSSSMHILFKARMGHWGSFVNKIKNRQLDIITLRQKR